LLKEEIIKILAFIFILATAKRNPNEWRYVNNIFCELESLDENSKHEEFIRVENEVNDLLETFTSNIHNISDYEIFSDSIDILLKKCLMIDWSLYF